MAITATDYSFSQLITGTDPTTTNSGQMLVIDENSLDPDFFNHVQNGGGDIRVCENSDGTNQIPLHVIFCDTGSDTVSLVTRKPTYATLNRGVYVLCGTTTTDFQPAANSTYGRENVYQEHFNAYRFESTGSQTDLTGNQSLTQSGTGAVIAGKIGNAVNCNGSAYWSASGNTRGNGSVTVSTWVKSPVSLSGNSWIFDDGDGLSGGIQLFLRPDGTVRLRVDEIGNDGGIIDTTDTINDNAWHKIDCVIEALGSAKLYVDGVLQPASLDLSNYGDISPTENFKICERVDLEASDPFIGAINVLGLYSGKKSSSYIATEYENENNPGAFWAQSTPTNPSGGGSSVTLTVDGLSMSQSLTEPSITQESALSAQSVSQSTVLGNVSLNQLQSISASGLTQSNLVESAALTQGYLLSVDDIKQQQLAELSNLSVSGTLSTQAVSQIQQLTESAISQQGTLNADGLTNANNLDNVDLTQAFTLVIDSLSNAQSVSQPTLGQFNGLIVQSIANSHTISESGLIQASVLVIDSVTQQQGLGFITFEDEPRILTLRATIGKSDISAKIALSDITARIGG